MRHFLSVYWTESLKSLRSRVPWALGLGLCMLALVDGLFMAILKDPEAARSMGLIGAKAQLAAGSADWPTFFNVLGQGLAVGGMVLFAMLTSWIFGREFSDRTVKEVLAVPTSRSSLVNAKMLVAMAWSVGILLVVVGLGLLVGQAVTIPGWSGELLARSLVSILGGTGLAILLLPYVALAASAGRGYVPAFGWTILTVALAQIAAVMGWGSWFPWAVPALFTEMAGPRAEQLGPHSYVIVLVASLLGWIATIIWWQKADQAR